jgi:hypothetical protein
MNTSAVSTLSVPDKRREPHNHLNSGKALSEGLDISSLDYNQAGYLPREPRETAQDDIDKKISTAAALQEHSKWGKKNS